MKHTKRIVSATVGVVALFGMMLMSNPAQAQRGGDRHDDGRNTGPATNQRPTHTTPARTNPQPSRTSHSPQADRGHGSHTNHQQHTDYRSRHTGYINVDFGRHVPHTTYQRVWVPGHYHTTTQRVLVSQGHYDTVVIPARYEDRWHNGHIDHVLVQPECVTQVWHPAEYENRTVQTWVPGYYKTVADTHYHHTKPSISIGGVFRF